ncbi:MAG: RNA-guided endonuclease IscB [Candidatus Competibacteraceae bacterium]
MNRVFVLSSTHQPLMLCHPARARQLLTAGRAAVFRLQPFTIILKERADGDVQPIEFKIDPGSKTTGIALVGLFPKQGRVALFGAHLHHRGDAIRQRLADRRARRRSRRQRQTRYREPRFDNRTRSPGWLPPSLQSRVDNVATWFNRLASRAPISECHVETARFDTHALQNPEITGVKYQQSELMGYEVREYLLEKWHRRCAYCGKANVPLEIEHLTPRSRGGSDRVSNLTLACTPCNQKKGHRTAAEFGYPELQTKAKAPLKDAAAINSIRYAIGHVIRSMGLPTRFWSGGRTKRNRVTQGYPKDHWIDAACVGEAGEAVALNSIRPLAITATGRGRRQVVKIDRYGFPRGAAGRVKRIHGFQTGDLARLCVPKGKYAGVHTGRVAGIRADGRLDLNKITRRWVNFTLLQRGDGYAYA